MNKMKLYVACLLLVLAGGQAAADGLSVNSLSIRRGGTANLEIVLESETALYKTFQMDIELPEGLRFVRKELTSQPTTMSSPRLEAINPVVNGNVLSDQHARLAVYSSTATPLAAGSDLLISVQVSADENLSLGDLAGGRVYAIEFSTTGNVATHFDEVAFTADVTNLMILDENSTTLPEEAEGVNVRVLRSIRADAWNSICLPFDMTEAQVKAAFGDDVKLGDFTSWSSEEDDDESIVGIAIRFEAVTAIAANHPYIIKVTAPVSEFTVDGVNVEVEEEPKVQVGKKSAERGFFYGTYTKTIVPEECLFLSSNRFWYSTGSSPIKGYRGYFKLRDVLDAYYNGGEAKVLMLIEDDPDGLQMVNSKPLDGNYYDLQGRKMPNGKLPRGMYIVNGNKVLK